MRHRRSCKGGTRTHNVFRPPGNSRASYLSKHLAMRGPTMGPLSFLDEQERLPELLHVRRPAPMSC